MNGGRLDVCVTNLPNVAGELVPIPTLPLEVAKVASVVLLSVVEAAIDVPVIAPVDVKDDTLTALPAVKLLTATLVVTPD